jgi:hypothetical protein
MVMVAVAGRRRCGQRIGRRGVRLVVRPGRWCGGNGYGGGRRWYRPRRFAGHTSVGRQGVFERTLLARPELAFAQCHVFDGEHTFQLGTAAHDTNVDLQRVDQRALFASPFFFGGNGLGCEEKKEIRMSLH